MSYGNWKHILAVFNFHNFVFNSIFVIKHTWRDPLVRSAAPFDLFFSFLLHFTFFSWVQSIRSSFFFGSSSPLIFGLQFFLFLFFFFFFHWVHVFGFFFWFFITSNFRSSILSFFSFFFLLFSLGSGFLVFFLLLLLLLSLGSVSLGTRKKKKSCTKWQVWGL